MKLKNLIAPLGVLGLAVIILSGLSMSTRSVAAKNFMNEKQQIMKLLLPGSESFEQETYEGEDSNILAVFKGQNGYVIETKVAGYVDDITLWVGVGENGNITGTMVKNMSETWGLGRRAMTDISFLSQFLGTKGDAEIGVNVDALSGATVTSKAIVKGVNSAAAFVTGADVSSSATEWGD